LAADPYETLGVRREASQADIQKAYRRLAKKLHPDLNPGDKKAEEEFKRLSAAYDILGDADKRARFDRGEIDASGAEAPRQRYYRDFAEGEGARFYTSDAGFADFADGDDIFSEFFRSRGRSGSRGRSSFRMRGEDVHYHIDLDFLDAINGGKRQVTLGDGETIDITIPPGTRDGQVLRLRRKGRPGLGGGPPGDALIEIAVRPHPLFTRRGDDIHVELPVALADAVLGGKTTAPTPSGPVSLTIPKWSNTGTVLRLKGKGVPRPGGGRGDEYVTLKIMLPDRPDPELEQLIRQWAAARAGRSHQTAEA
jgi:DnaJ-class molecular chaperone